MFDISIVDKNFTSKKKTSYELSILASRGGFSFLLFDTDKHEVGVFKHTDFDAVTYDDLLKELRNILIGEPLLQQNYKGVKAMYHNTTITLLPDEIIQEENLKHYLTFQHPMNELDEIHYCPINGHRAQAVFALPNYMANEIIEVHPRTKFLHPSIPLISMAMEKSKKHHGNLVHINKSQQFFDLIIIRDYRLYLYNTFTFKTDNDFVYFVMSACKQLNVVDAGYAYYISGLIRPENEDFALLQRFLGPVSMDIIPKSITNLKQLERKTAPFMFASLFGLSLCE